MKRQKHYKNLDKLISRTISREKPKFDFDKWKEKHKKEIQIYESQTADRQISHSAQLFNIWRIVMKSKIARVTAAVVIAVGAFLGLNHLIGDGTSKAYGMPDVPRIFHSAKTIHMKGKIYFPEEKQGRIQRFFETEHWLDLETGRWRLIIPSTCSSPEGFTIKVVENICDGSEYEISIDHTNKEVQFAKLSDFQRQLFNRRNIHTIMQLMFNTPEIFDEYEVIGNQIIGNREYEIWQAVIEQADFMFSAKVHSWLCPQTGQLVKLIIWLSEQDGYWQKKMEIEEIELNNHIPREVFQPQIPQEYTMVNTKETAKQKLIQSVSGSIKNYYLWTHLLFILPDGSAILCWSSEDNKSSVSQEELFAGLQVGGDFPKLPFQVDSLETSYKKQTIRYEGHHLMYTTKDGKFYEWGLYVPSQVIEPEIAQLLSFQVIYSDNVDDSKFEGGLRLGLTPDILIKNREEFDELVKSAMKALGDDTNNLNQISYEEVLQIIERLR